VSGELRQAGDDAPEKCTFCSRDAVGPCASGRRLVCGECCTLTEGGATTFAICLDCDRKKGRSLGGPWRGFGLWLLGILVLLAVVIVLLEWLWPSSR
jgi:hypothetical protein